MSQTQGGDEVADTLSSDTLRDLVSFEERSRRCTYPDDRELGLGLPTRAHSLEE